MQGNYKCPGYYCIPWRYQCDGLWHCPFGTDEHKKDCERKACPGMFKCVKSVICIAVEDICNGFADCPSVDDEYLCKPFIPQCPEACQCLGYVIHCKYMKFEGHEGPLEINDSFRNKSF